MISGYDAWKTATPSEYEGVGDPPDDAQDEPTPLEEILSLAAWALQPGVSLGGSNSRNAKQGAISAVASDDEIVNLVRRGRVTESDAMNRDF